MRGRRGALGEGEEVLLDVRLHPLSLLVPTLLALVGVALAASGLIEEPHWPHLVRDLLFGLLGLSLLYGGGRLLGWRSRRVLVTSERLVVRAGLLRRRRSSVSLRRIVSLQTHQRLLERVVGRGTIAIETVGESAPLLLEEVARPLRVTRTINAALDAALGVEAQQERDRGSGPADVVGRLNSLYRLGFITKAELDERAAGLGRETG